MFGYYKINELYVGRLDIIIEQGFIGTVLSNTNTYVILKKYKKNLDYRNGYYKEIFSKTIFTPQGCSNYEGELIVAETNPIVNFCNEKELKTGRISKKRLISIYNKINEKENEQYESKKIKELIK